MNSFRLIFAFFVLVISAAAQVTTTGFLNQPRAEVPGTLLSHPITNGSEPIGRTTSINYLNGWIIVGGESPGSRVGSDLLLRVYDISNPGNPVRRLPSDFGLSYPNNSWYFNNFGWNAHGTAQTGTMLVPHVIGVSSFGGVVERGGQNGSVYPGDAAHGLGFNRSSQAGPWEASFPWYGSPDTAFTIQQTSTQPGANTSYRLLATFDHVGAFGGGDWHPMFFGDLLIYARSGGAGRDGVVVYRMQYNDFDNPNTRSITPQYVASLSSGFTAYWPVFYSDGTALYVIGAGTDVVMAADITSATVPGGTDEVTLAANLTVPGLTNAPYPVFQDNFGFIHNRKIDMNRFVAGDANPIVLSLNENTPPVPAGQPAAPSGVDTSQMSLALGNLWLTGGYPGGTFGQPGYQAQGMGVWVHQQAADTTPPRVSYHIPQSGRTNYPRHAPLSFLIFEHGSRGAPRNGIDFTVRPVLAGETLGTAVDGYLIHDFSGVLTFTPTNGLTADTTYQVDFLSQPAAQIGWRDAAGNFIEPYSFRFSTGGGLTATAPPVWKSFTASLFQPAPNQPVTVTAAATGTGPLEYRFNFDGTWTAWSTNATAGHTYTMAGRPRVLAQVRDAAGHVVTNSLTLLVIQAPPVNPRPTQSSTLAVGDDGGVRRVWSVNPDANTVTVIHTATGAKVAEHAVGANPRSIARDANGRYWVTCFASDEIRILNADGSLHQTLSLEYGDGPFGIAPSPDGTLMYVTLYSAGRLHRYSVAAPGAPTHTVANLNTPRAIAVSANGSRVLVTRFISPELEGQVAEFNATLAFQRVFPLALANSIDGGDRASGVPNYLAGIAISPDGTRAAVVGKQDNTLRGLAFGVGDLTHETTVRSVITFLDLVNNLEVRHARRDFDNSDSPTAVAYTPPGDMLLVTLQGNNTLVGLDALNLTPLNAPLVNGSMATQPAVLTLEVGTGLAPQGVLIDPVSQRIVTQDFMGRSMTVLNAQPFLAENRTTLPLLATTAAVSTELLSASVLQGKRLFYNAADPRMSADSYISCATCHVDGGHDGRVWDFTGRGEGFRRTTDLRGRGGMGHGAVHWSGNFDEIQDFEHDIRGPFGGTGFLDLTPQQFSTLHPSPATGKSGLSSDLDALAAYVASLTPAHLPRSPSRNANGTFTTEALAGQAVFAAQNCASCHSGDRFTNSTLMNVGTQSLLSGSRLGQTLAGIDTPTLHGLHATRVYLHHGQATTLGEVFAYAGGALFYGAQAQMVGTSGVDSDSPLEGGGGFERGYLGGATAYLSTNATAGVRFNNVDGGSGGTARVAFRYLRQYNGGTAALVINGVSQNFTALQQSPNNDWQVSGWRWHTVEASLNAGATNTIEIQRGASNDLRVNVLLVANASQLALAQPHRAVQSLSTTERTNLLAYLGQLDGRDASGVPLPPAAPPSPQPPSIVSGPSDATLALGNALNFVVTVSGSGPFSYEWRRGTTVAGTDAPMLQIAAVTMNDAGSYTCTVTNAQGSAVTTPAVVSVNPPLSITTATLAASRLEQAYNAVLSATGGVSSRTWSLAGGVLPPGITLSPAGVLSGTPLAAGRAEFTVQVSDASGNATRLLTLDAVPVGGFVSDPDLVLHYTFDEGSGNRVWDSATGGNNHATTVANAHWISDGRFGGAYGPSSMSGIVNRFTPANQGDLNFNPRGDAFTVSVWVRTTASSGYNTVIGKDQALSPFAAQYRMWMVNSPTSFQTITGGQHGSGITTPAVNDAQWHLLALVNFNDAGTWRTRFYFDGVLLNTTPAGPLPPLTDLWRVGDTTRGGNGWLGQIDDLRFYRRALSQTEIAQLYSPPTGPTATLAVAPGQEVSGSRPYAEFDVTFSEIITGLTVEDFTHSGTHAALTTLTAGTHFRLRIAGYAAGLVSAQLPAGRVTAASDAEPNNASNIVVINHNLSVSDDLAPLSDEFDDAATQTNWQRVSQTDGWGASKLETWDIDVSRDGHMRLMPYSSSWYGNWTGEMVFKNVTGDFVATLRMQARRRGGLSGRPSSIYSLGGIMVRTPKAYNNAAPNPDPGPGVILPYPPPAFGQPNHYTTPWTPGAENYIFLSYGYADASAWGNVANTWYCEVKTTLNSNSTLYAVQNGIPANTDLVTLQMVRVGQTFLVLRRHGAAGPWIIENRYTRSDMPATLQLGVTTYTDWDSVDNMNEFHHNRTILTSGNPDLVVDADYLRLRRPAPAVTSTALQNLTVTGQNGTLRHLADTALATSLGDNANLAYEPPGETFEDWLAEHLTPAQLVQPALTDPQGDADGNGLRNLLEFALGSDEISPLDLQIIGGTAQLTLTRNSAARGITFIVERTHDFITWTPLATSVDGSPLSGTATISEGPGTVRILSIESPASGLPTFYRVRVLTNE